MAQLDDKPPFRRIRSFVKREGRLTPGQETALKKHNKGTSAEHKKFMKRRLLMGDTIRQAHKAFKKKNG